MADDTYDVGYKKPPVYSRFAKGKSGNPRGRPKKSEQKESLRALIELELDEKVVVHENGRSILMIRRKALAKLLVNSGLRGDKKSLDLLSKLLLPPSRQTAEKLDVENLPKPVINLIVSGEKLDDQQKRQLVEKAGQSASPIPKEDS